MGNPPASWGCGCVKPIRDIYKNTETLGGGIFGNFHPYLGRGRWTYFDSYFSNGLKPPTSLFQEHPHFLLEAVEYLCAYIRVPLGTTPNSPTAPPSLFESMISKNFPWTVGYVIVPRRVYGCFLKWWYPQIIHFNRVFHYKPSILGYHYFRKQPYSSPTDIMRFCWAEYGWGVTNAWLSFEISQAVWPDVSKVNPAVRSAPGREANGKNFPLGTGGFCLERKWTEIWGVLC